MVLARLVDVSTLGEILYATVFANIVIVLSSYGFDNLVIREVSQGRYGIVQVASNLLFAKLILSGALILLIALFIELVHIPLRHPSDLWFYIGAGMMNSFINSINALRKASGDFTTELRVSLARSGLFFGGTLLAVYFCGATTLLVGQVRLLSRVLCLVLAVGIFGKEMRKHGHDSCLYRPQSVIVRELFVVGFPFALQALLGTAYFQLDSLVLGALKTATEVGYYQASMQVVSAVMLVPIAVIQAYYPRLARALSDPDAKGVSLMREMMAVLALLGFCLTFTFGLGAPFLITFLYGVKMQPSVVVMQILSLVFLIRSVAGGFGVSLISLGWQKVQVLAGFIAVVGSLALNFLLIPKGGFVAVAWINLLINAVILCIYSFWWRAVSPRFDGVTRIRLTRR